MKINNREIRKSEEGLTDHRHRPGISVKELDEGFHHSSPAIRPREDEQPEKEDRRHRDARFASSTERSDALSKCFRFDNFLLFRGEDFPIQHSALGAGLSSTRLKDEKRSEASEHSMSY